MRCNTTVSFALDRNAEPEEPSPSIVLSGTLVLVVATKLSLLPLYLENESEEPPTGAVSSGWSVFGVVSQLG